MLALIAITTARVISLWIAKRHVDLTDIVHRLRLEFCHRGAMVIII